MEAMMFENISFIDFFLDKLSSQHPISVESIQASRLFPGISEENFRVMSSHTEDTSFRLSGKLRVMTPLPITSAARKQLLYLESFSLSQSDAGHYTERSKSNTYLMLYTYAGKGILSYEGREFHLQAGDGFFIDCRKHHVFRSEGLFWERSDLYFNGYTADAFFSSFSQNGDVVFHSRSGYQARLEKLLQSYQRIQPNRDLMIHAGLTDILSWLLGVKTDKPLTEIEETVYRVIQHLQGHYREPIGMDELAGIAGFSKYHLSREFHRLTGYAPISYLLMIRMEHAGFLLLNTDLSISQISEQCGFNSEQYMCRQFQKHFGTTPGRYRRLYRS